MQQTCDEKDGFMESSSTLLCMATSVSSNTLSSGESRKKEIERGRAPQAIQPGESVCCGYPPLLGLALPASISTWSVLQHSTECILFHQTLCENPNRTRGGGEMEKMTEPCACITAFSNLITMWSLWKQSIFASSSVAGLPPAPECQVLKRTDGTTLSCMGCVSCVLRCR